ncbi:hypothetical protein PFICI_02781 [Pestalotiopsis fici W106-1]|uniref:Uncharacterized protein n=1 Tax=Pestalotiopsis fici (strain W106-1 / CGMCC3.15140) TaxID=1229662 RepID=W3XHR9_PESFW|nr:uncharacterized protein PFICI_02781 [Pestalotiopsis fici W106-1]ETS84756.1 hypothetical protein PFICI_02781 [Pestalotiopsis fici W106-1]
MPSPLPDVATSSPLSSPDSFATANATPPNLHDVTVTDISTPEDDGTQVNYRKAKQLPPVIKQHCQIYLEENLHVLGMKMLERLQSCSGSEKWNTYGQNGDNSNGSGSVYCPPPNQLAFLGTLTIHPDLTTRPREENWTDVSSAAMVYLRSVLQTVGPINARFQEAFQFGQSTRRSPNGDSSDAMYDAGGAPQLHGRYGKNSVWRRGQDFFNVVGWAFNCSVLYPNRWEYWRQWLEFMCDVLEADILERARIDEEEHDRAGGEEGECSYAMLSNSILAGYLNQCERKRTNGAKSLMAVIFADGQTSSARQFQEIWDKEHKGISRDRIVRKRKRKVNIEKGDFGGLLDDDSVYSSQNSEPPPTPQKRRSGSESPALQTSYVESIALRQRLFYLLSYLCNFLPKPPISLPDLYEFYEREIRHLPLSIFTAFVDSTTSSLRTDSQISILQNILSLYMPNTSVKPSKVDPERYDVNGTSPAILERCFLPYAAYALAAEENAKVSVLLEEIVKLVWTVGTEPFSDKLLDQVNKGIKAREAQVKKKVGGTRARRSEPTREDPDLLEAKTLLQESSKRLLQLAELIMDEADEGQTDEADEMDHDMAEVSYMTARSS